MRVSAFLLVCAVAALPACSSMRDKPSASVSGDITFIVGSSIDGGMLGGVEVLAARGSGLDSLGKTDATGRLKISKEAIAEASAVLFCDPHFFCGAFRTTERDFLGYTEKFIVLAPGAVL